MRSQNEKLLADKEHFKTEIDGFIKGIEKLELDLSSRDLEMQMHLNKIEMLEKLNKNVFKDLDESLMQLNNVSMIDHVPPTDQNPARDISFAITEKPTEIPKKVEQPFSNSSFDDIQ